MECCLCRCKDGNKSAFPFVNGENHVSVLCDECYQYAVKAKALLKESKKPCVGDTVVIFYKISNTLPIDYLRMHNSFYTDIIKEIDKVIYTEKGMTLTLEDNFAVL